MGVSGLCSWLLVVAACLAQANPGAERAKRNQARVSYKECLIEEGERQNCGYFGITDRECYSRGCCWGRTQADDVPWCYHSIPTISPLCELPEANRIECGYYGIRKEGCLHMECCWRPGNDVDVPWCFHEKRVPVYTGECGVPAIPPDVLSSARIVGGVNATPNSWPWQASLQHSRYGHYCGGSIINNQWVVSAAHCIGFNDNGQGKVVLGEHNQLVPEGTEVEVLVETIIPQEDFGMDYDYGNPESMRETFKNDIMLIKLAEPVTFSDVISPVCMPVEGQVFTPGKHCYATGYGATVLHWTETIEPNPSSTLQQVMLPIVDPDVCNSTEYYAGRIHDNNVCVGYEEGYRSACYGDSGGPLVCYDSTRDEGEAWVLNGVTSWGRPGCGHENGPNVYVNPSKHLLWIEKVIAHN